MKIKIFFTLKYLYMLNMVERNIGGRQTGHYTKYTDGYMYTDHKHLKVIYFLILNEIIEYLVEIFTVCFSKISI